MTKAKVALVSLASFAAGVATMSAIVVSVGQAGVKGTTHDHLLVKGMAWLGAKYVTKGFDPNNTDLLE